MTTSFNINTFRAVDSIDADLFSSDVFERYDRIEEMQRYIERWSVKLNKIKAELDKVKFVKGTTTDDMLRLAKENKYGFSEVMSPNSTNRLTCWDTGQFEFAGGHITTKEAAELLEEWNKN